MGWIHYLRRHDRHLDRTGHRCRNDEHFVARNCANHVALYGGLIAAVFLALAAIAAAQITRTESALDRLMIGYRLVRTAQGSTWQDRDVEITAYFEPRFDTGQNATPEAIDLTPQLTATQKDAAKQCVLIAAKKVYQLRGNLPTPTPDPSPTPTRIPTPTPTP